MMILINRCVCSSDITSTLTRRRFPIAINKSLYIHCPTTAGWLTMKNTMLTSICFVLCYWSMLISACRDVEIVKRDAWGAKLSLENDTMNMPVQHIFIHHTAGLTCNDKPSCSRVMRGIQSYHMDTLGWDDIGYNFLIGGDGRVYEGRSWTRVGAHTYGFNRVSIAFSLMGNFVDRIPNDAMLGTTRRMITCAREEEYVTNTTKIHGHRDGGCTECPGEALYEIIKHWPDFQAGPLNGTLCYPN